MGELFSAGRSKGFQEGGQDKEIDAFAISTFKDEYRVGYVLGFGESTYPGVPPEYRYHLMGEIAAKSAVPIAHFERYGNLSNEALEQFKEGYQGAQEQEFSWDDDEIDD